MQILQSYITTIRPLLNPICDYLLVSTTGRQYNSFTTAMTLLVNEAIGKYINPTRYRQIVETESAEKLDPADREIISQDQKHSSVVAKLSYRKQLSRDVATKGKQCMEKIVGDSRTETTEQLATIVSDINRTNMEFDQAVIDKARSILQPKNLCDNTNALPDYAPREAPSSFTGLAKELSTCEGVDKPIEDDVIITGSKSSESGYNCASNMPSVRSTASSSQVNIITNDVEVKKEEAERQVTTWGKSRKFTAEEDKYLKLGIAKYGKGAWSLILHDKNFVFHPKRNRDSLRMRAEAGGFKTKRNKSNV